MLQMGKGVLLAIAFTVTLGCAAWIAWSRKNTLNEAEEPGSFERALCAYRDESTRALPVPAIQTETSPLVHEARRFASYLNPPKPLVKLEVPPKKVRQPSRPKDLAGPAVMRSRFTLLATSLHLDDPVRSMALIEEPGAGQRWVRVGMQVGNRRIVCIEKGRLILEGRAEDTRTEVEISRAVTTIDLAQEKALKKKSRGLEERRAHSDTGRASEDLTRFRFGREGK